jgi:hypothetical protein
MYSCCIGKSVQGTYRTSYGHFERTSKNMSAEIESSIVRENLMGDKNYRPYCGNTISVFEPGSCHNPRTVWNGKQLACPMCGWESQFPDEFLDRYKQKWLLEK